MNNINVFNVNKIVNYVIKMNVLYVKVDIKWNKMNVNDKLLNNKLIIVIKKNNYQYCTH